SQLGTRVHVRRRRDAAPAEGHDPASHRLLRQHAGEPQRRRSAQLVRARPSLDRQHEHPDHAGRDPDRRAVPGRDEGAAGEAEAGAGAVGARLSAVRLLRVAGAAPDTAGPAAVMRRLLLIMLPAAVVVAGPLPAAQVPVENLNVSPVYEGWESNPDGTFTLVFGYFNRSWDSSPVVPIGPDNNIGPGAADQGQPTYFLPRRNHFVFRIKVPADFGTKEVVWTLVTLGKAEKAYGTLKPDYVIDDMILMSNIGAGGA